MASESVVAPVLSALARDPSRPRFTGYTEAGRTELSGAALLNWAAKTAGLLVDEIGAQPGDQVLVSTPAHWQTAGILLGAWWAGVAVTDDADQDNLSVAAFIPPGGNAHADEVFLVSGHPLGLPNGQVPAGIRDFTTAVLPQADHFVAPFAGDPHLAARTAGLPIAAATLSSAIRSPSGLVPGQRVLTCGSWQLSGSRPGVVGLLLRPLAAGASVIHSLDLDPNADSDAWAARAAAERADVTLGVSVAGLRRLD